MIAIIWIPPVGLQACSVSPFNMSTMPYCGELIANQQSTGYDERFKFTGKERDEETGYLHFDARNFSDILGNWLSVDPLADKNISNSPYVYCEGNPIKYVDPDGQCPVTLFATASAVISVYYLSAKALENSSGHRDMRIAGYGMLHPINACRTGIVDFPSWGYTEIACNFFENFQNCADFTKGDGQQGNAFRHAIWQAMLTNNLGIEDATRIGNAHEDFIPRNMNQRSFQSLDDADRMADLLNNIIGRQIGDKYKGASNKVLAQKALEEYKNNGLWIVAGDKENGYTVQIIKLSQEQYEKALQVLEKRGNNGLLLE